MRRYMMVEKTKDADRIGILVGTLGASKYGAIIDQVRQNVKKAGKRVYTFLVGKPNVPKLANFPGLCYKCFKSSKQFYLCARQLIDLDILNIEYLLSFSAGRRSEINQNKYSKFDTSKSMSCRGH